jgi:hypothetical protein
MNVVAEWLAGRPKNYHQKDFMHRPRSMCKESMRWKYGKRNKSGQGIQTITQ